MALYALLREEDSVHNQSSTGLFSDRDAAQIANVLGTTASDLRGE